jgi:hypothetical protein
MEKIDYEKATEKALVMSEFYYSLSLLHHKAINYVAHGETQDDKYARVKEIIQLVTKTGVQIVDYNPVFNEEPCDIPPCRRDEMTGMCMCNASESVIADLVVDFTRGVV